MNILRRSALSRNFSAQLYSQFITFTVQLGSAPLLISIWGVENYGIWLLLTAIPTYLSFSDFGFTFVAKNDMAMRVSRGDKAGALETFQSILSLLLVVGPVVGTLCVLVVITAPLDSVFQLGTQSLGVVRTVLVSQIFSAILYQLCLLFYAGVRSEGRSATETIFVATWRLIEAAAILLIAAFGGNLAAAAIAALAMRLLNVAVLVVWLRKTSPWIRLSTNQARLERIAELLGPSFSYMLVPICNSMLIQGPLIILGIFGSPAAVALFSLTRTVSRLGMTIANMINYSFVPEYSFARGRGDSSRFRNLMKMQGLVIIIIGVSYVSTMVVAGDFFVNLLSRGHISPSYAITMGLTIAVLSEIFWTGLFSPLSAVNAHRPASAALAATSLIGAVVVMLYFHSPEGIAFVLAAIHFGTLVCVSRFYIARFGDVLVSPTANGT